MLPIFLTTVLVTGGAVNIIFLPFIVPVQAELKGVSLEKTELLSSKTTKDNDNDISDQSIRNEEKTSLNGNFAIYEGLGIKLDNYTPWTIVANSDKPTCNNINLCFIDLGILNVTNTPQTWIIQDNFESQTIKEYCKCNTLEDYERHFYKKMISQFDNFSFINENQTTISEDKLAIQLEYEFSSIDTKIHTFTVFTNTNDSFYQFIYYADQESFPTYLSDFKKIVDTVEFTSHKES